MGRCELQHAGGEADRQRAAQQQPSRIARSRIHEEEGGPGVLTAVGWLDLANSTPSRRQVTTLL